jgi:two-component system sensor histidine kinase ChiS
VRQAHFALAETQGLKNKLADRERTLQRLQAKLNGVLNGIDRAFLVANAGGEITLVNRTLESWLGLRGEDLLGQPLTRLFATETARELQRILARLIEGNHCGQEGEAAQSERRDPDSCLSLSGVPIQSGNRETLQATLQPTLLEVEDEQQLLLFIGTNGQAPAGSPTPPLPRRPKPADASGAEPVPDQRRLMVDAMNLTLDLWVHQTATTKVELARRSGLWSVYTDRDGWQRTQTLDRYLTLDTLPQRPRRRVVTRTAEYVLGQYPGETDSHRQLGDILTRLQAL